MNEPKRQQEGLADDLGNLLDARGAVQRTSARHLLPERWAELEVARAIAPSAP